MLRVACLSISETAPFKINSRKKQASPCHQNSRIILKTKGEVIPVPFFLSSKTLGVKILCAAPNPRFFSYPFSLFLFPFPSTAGTAVLHSRLSLAPFLFPFPHPRLSYSFAFSNFSAATSHSMCNRSSPSVNSNKSRFNSITLEPAS